MKRKGTIIFSLLFVLLFLPNILLAQEVVLVPDNINGDYFGVINKFVMGDTTETGERAHPNAIYRLERGKIYDINEQMRIDFNFTLDALPDDPSNPTRPPMVIVGKDAQGSFISPLFYLIDDSTNIKFQNIIFSAIPFDENFVARTQWLIFLEGAYHRFEMDNCIALGFSGSVLQPRYTDRCSYYFTNNIFFNNIHLTSVGGGGTYSNTVKTAYNDTIKFVNNTFFNNGDNNFLSWEFVDYIEFSHNTMYNMSIAALWLPYLTNAKFNDNLFYDYQTVGETEWEYVNGHWDKGTPRHGHASILKLNLVDPQTLADHRMEESDRKVEAKNNVYYWSQTIRDYWANNTSQKDIDQGYSGKIYPVTWINHITDSMFTDKEHYPYLVQENNVELDPGFDATMGAAVLAKEIPFVKEYRKVGWTTLNVDERYYNPDGPGKLFDLNWPLSLDLTYTNTDVLTHAEGNFPAGDLNWYPDKKAEWLLTGVKKDPRQSVPSNYKLSQNYPNPFNPTTEISFSIPVAGNTTLAVYNVLGQKVATLVSEKLSAGSYKYQFDASNLTSGIYFYKLQSSNYSQIRKMTLLK